MSLDATNPASTPRIPERISPSFLPLGIMLVAFILYTCTLSKHYSEGEDGALYVIEVTSPKEPGDLFHPNHLAFNGLNRVVYLLCRQVGYRGNACVPMQIVNALGGALTLGLMVRILRRLVVDDRLTLCWIAVTTFCFGFWSYSTQPETYILPLPLILMCIDLLVGLADDRFSYKTFAWLGFFGAVATLLHQQHVLVLFATGMAALLAGYRYRSEVPISRMVAGFSCFAAVAATIVGTAYFSVAIGVLHLHDLGAIIHWSKGHAQKGSWVPWSYTNPIQSIVVGFARAVCSGHFLYGFDSFYEPVSRRFPAKMLLEERYLGRHLPSWVQWTCLAAAVAALGSMLAVAQSLGFPTRAEPASPEHRRRLRAFDTIVISITLFYYIFNSLWEPTNIEFWIVLLPVAAMALASMQARRPKAVRWWFAGAVLAVSLLVVNGLGSILPQARHDTDFWYQANRYLIDNARPGDIIITDGAYISDMYLRVYTGGDVIPVRRAASRELPGILRDGGPRRVWISSWALEPLPEVRRTGMLAAVDEKALQLAFESVRDRMVVRNEAPHQTVWELMPPARLSRSRGETAGP